MDELKTIKEFISQDRADEAIEALDRLIASGNLPAADEAYYLRGNAYRKKGDWKKALDNYLEAIEINPESPAVHAKEILMDILNFYNKDMYNQ